MSSTTQQPLDMMPLVRLEINRIISFMVRLCINIGMCEDEGLLHPDQSSWKKGNCILCECNEGVKTCFAQSCPELNCKHVSKVL